MRVRASWIIGTVAVLLATAAAPPAGARKLNKPPHGFQRLFNGKDLTNWHGLIELPTRMKLSPAELAQRQAAADERMRAHWHPENGILTFDGKGDSLQTVRDYGN